VVEAGTDYANDSANCRLAVRFGRLTVTWAQPLLYPDAPALAGPYSRACRSWSTTDESHWTFDGRQGEYRRFLNHCTGAQFEQWTVMTKPQIAFWHPITPQSSRALVSGIVDSAVVPPQTDPQRQLDQGLVRQISQRSGAYYLRLDRVVLNLDGTLINHNPATYEYRLNGSVGGATLPRGPDRCDWWTDRSCNMAWLLSQFAKGPHPADGSFPVDGAFVDLAKTSGGYGLGFKEPFQYRL
jgi:hypothetical protein